VVAINNHREVADMVLGVPYPFAIEDAEQWIEAAAEQAAAGTAIEWLIELRTGRNVVGICSLLWLATGDDRAEIGYRLNPAYWGQGIATEASRMAISYAFRELNVERVYGICFGSNAVSMRVLEQSGLRFEGRNVHHIKKNGTYEDLVWFGAIREWWSYEQFSPDL